MKILHVLDHSLPLQTGYSFRTAAILRAQRAKGWETVHLTTPRHGVSGSSWAESENEGGFTFWRSAYTRGPLDRSPLWPLFEMQATTRALRRLAQRERPDILHAHSPSLTAHPAVTVGRELGIPVVYEVRGFWEDAAVDHGTTHEGSLRYRYTRWLETRALRRVQGITAICDGIKNDIVQRGFDAQRITLIPNAVDVDRFQPITGRNAALAASLGLNDHYVLGFCGSFYAYEGLDLAIRAMPEVLKAVPSARLLLVGGGPVDAALRGLVAELGLAEHVIFTGRVPNAQVQEYYSLIDVLVFPRKRMRLTELVTPLKPLETMAQCLPVVASDVGGHRELIRHRETGLLFPADDAHALAAQVIELQRDPALQRSLRENGRVFVSAERTWQRSVDNYEHVYRQAQAAMPR